MKQWYLYIMSNEKNWVLYTWVTSNLIKRIQEHKNWDIEWFTQKYFIKKLVYYEAYDDIYEAIQREKRIKKWNREWKLNLIEKENKNWKDLYYELIDEEEI